MFPGSAIAGPPRRMNPDSCDLRDLKDDQLLARFFQQHEDGAFAVLVERYGPLVYGVCQRILGEAADAEDAFQATFLVLVRKGATLRDPGRLASWLYGVAYRTARKVKAKVVLRSKLERKASEMPTNSQVSDMTYEELRAILDEEISHLPEKYSLPLVLCYLEGKTNAQAAAQLGWPEGSMSRRLSRARELLRSRLARRGLALSAALIASVFSRPVVACVPPHVVESTIQASTLVAHGVALEDVVSTATANLVQDVISGMSGASKFATSAIVAVVASILIVLGVVAWQEASLAFAGNISLFHRGPSAHALTTPQTAATAAVSVGGAVAGSTATLATPSAAAQPAATSCGAVPVTAPQVVPSH